MSTVVDRAGDSTGAGLSVWPSTQMGVSCPSGPRRSTRRAHPIASRTHDHGLGSQLDQLAPITLEEMVDEAALMTRVDRKYLLPLPALAEVIDATTQARVLTIDGLRSFAYRSDYLDTGDLASFHAAGRRRRRRWKVRGRTYLDSGTSWLEVKTRGPRGTTVKARVQHQPVADGLTAEGERFVVDTLASIGATLDPSELAPALVTRYRRSTLYLPEEQRPARATVDVDLTWSSPGGGESLDLPGLAVVETKGSTAPSSLDRALWHLGHRPVRMSKYGTGLSALHDDLPALKWHRTLRRHLAAA